jgi:hypothetical protein
VDVDVDGDPPPALLFAAKTRRVLAVVMVVLALIWLPIIVEAQQQQRPRTGSVSAITAEEEWSALDDFVSWFLELLDEDVSPEQAELMIRSALEVLENRLENRFTELTDRLNRLENRR